MYSATKMNFDTQNDDYFDNHYKFSQGILNEGEEGHNQVVQSLVFSKCQRDCLSTVSSVKITCKRHFPQH